ncbi:Uncharacterized conserved protein UCP028301 [Candidatus Magnetomorum sp. HK-1]|nr:Uncharacterized conserved protein UCP028301 [Candidatus Magnetomorum sp. HK-1]
MARLSYQNEVPKKGRINIYLDNKKGNEKGIELIQRNTIIGDFTQNPKDHEGDIEDIKRIPITKATLGDVMKDMNVGLNMTVDSEINKGEEIDVKLKFGSIKDFGPDSIVEQVPILRDLMKVRGLLNDLKAKVITNKQFKRELEMVVKDKSLLEKIKKELETLCLEPNNKTDEENLSTGDS